jgi:autotransporter-associated beta strand protein
MQRATTPCGKRRVRHARAGLALSQLSAMLALAFTPGMQAQGATFTDSITFSTGNQSLWGSSASAELGTNIYLGTQWGTYAGASPVKSYTAGSISELRDPVFGVSLGSYGLAAAFQSSGRVGFNFAPDLRGGSLSYTREVNPVMTLPSTFTANTLFTVSAIDLVNKPQVLNTTPISIQGYATGTVNFDASVAATACFVTCTAPTNLDFTSYPMSQGMYTPYWSPTLNGPGTAHAGTHINISSYNNPFYLYKDSRSIAGISVDSRLLEVNLNGGYDLGLDVSVKAPVMVRLEFDKPVTEILGNGKSILHTDRVVSFALGSTVSLQFGDDVGTLVKRSYFLDSPTYTTHVDVGASVNIETKVGCAMAIKAVGLSLAPPPGLGNCVSTSNETLTASVTSQYDREHNLNTVKASGTLGGKPFSEQQISGVLAANQVMQNTGGGATSMVRDNLTIRAAGARYENLAGAKTFVSGLLSVEERGTLLNSSGAELIIEAGGKLQNSFITGSPGEGDILNLGGHITNRGTILIDGRFKNTGTIDNFGSFTVTSKGHVFLDFAGGTFNNNNGATLTLAGMALLGTPINSSVPHRGTFNLNPGSTVISQGVGVGLGYKQVNEGTINVQPFTSFIISGELQVGKGGAHGSLNGQLSVNDTGTLSFYRSDDTSFAGVVEGWGTVRKLGANTLTMTAEQPFTGRTVVEGGRLVLLARNESGQFDIRSNSVLEMRVDEADRDSQWVFGTRFVGQGTLVKSGNGALRWGASKAVFAMGWQSLIDVQGGTLVAGSSGNEDWSQNASRLNVAAGATFWGAESNVRVDGLSGSGRIHSGYTNSGYQSFSFGVLGGGGTFSGVLADTDTGNGHIGRFVKEGSGSQILSGANTFTGPLTIKGGTVTVGNGGTTGSLATASIINNANLAFNRSDDTSFAGVISGTGNLSKQGAGQLLLSGNNSYTGTTDVRAGTLTLEGANSSRGFTIWSGSVLELQVEGAPRVNLADTQFSGQGTLRKTGSGTARWSESKAQFAMASGGLIDVRAGTLIGGSHGNEDWRLNKGDLNVGAGATFDGDEANVRVDAITGAGHIKSGYNGSGYSAFTMGVDNGSGEFFGALENSEATGHFVKEGTGTQILRGVNTFNGSLTVAGGTLALMGGNNRLNSAVTTYISNGAILDLGGNTQAWQPWARPASAWSVT